MALGFASPTILFLNTWDSPERSFCKQVFGALRDRGYTRYVEPCSGAFAMPLVGQAAGWDPRAMEASDVSLFSSIVGTMLAGGDFAALDVRLDGKPVDLPDAGPVTQAAHLLWTQLLARTQARPDVEYWRQMVADLIDRADEHRAAIAAKLTHMADRLGGLSYEPLDMWAHIERVADDPHTVVSINPPTYKGGFERFFDTKGRLTWAEPDYEVFDPGPGIPRLVELMEGRAALLLCQQQREPGDSAHPRPVFGRHLSLGQYVYLNSNRPDEVFEITGGPRVAPKKSAELTPMDLPVIGYDEEIGPDAQIRLIHVKAAVADYYRGLWMHRLNASPGSLNVLVVINGKAAGVMGYSTDSMLRPYPGVSKPDKLLMRFAFGAPHADLRLTRLVTMLCLQKPTVEALATGNTSMAVAASTGLVTVEYTRHPEAKGLRGLMKLTSRRDHPDGYQLSYTAEWGHDRPEAVLTRFLEKEAQWRARRK